MKASVCESRCFAAASPLLVPDFRRHSALPNGLQRRTAPLLCCRSNSEKPRSVRRRRGSVRAAGELSDYLLTVADEGPHVCK